MKIIYCFSFCYNEQQKANMKASLFNLYKEHFLYQQAENIVIIYGMGCVKT